MEKVKVTRQQAEAIRYRVDRALAVKIHATKGWNNPANKPLNDLSLDKFIRALYIGYEVEPEPFEIGGWATHLSGGAVREITGVEGNHISVADGEDEYIWAKEFARHSTPFEIAEEKERRLWSKLDRGNDEYRMTDVVQHKDYKGLYEVVDVYDTKHVEITDDFCDTSLTTTVDKLKLVCPAKKRLDVKTNE